MPICSAISIVLDKSVLDPTFKRGFGVDKVNGFSLLPKPADNITALLIFIKNFSFSYFWWNGFI